MISGSDLLIDAAENSFACYGRSSNEVTRPILISVATKENGSACYGRSGSNLPRPILFFVAAKENGFACGGRSGNEVPRPILIFAAAKENGPPATVVAVTAICRLRFYLRLTQRNA